MNTSQQDLVRFLTDRDVAAVTGCARSTLAKMRLSGNGPPFVRIGKSVKYPSDLLKTYLDGLPRRRSTSEPR